MTTTTTTATRTTAKRAKKSYEAPDMAAMIGRVARGMARRAEAGDLEALSALAQARADIDAAMVAAAKGLHDGEFGYSWTEVGRELGMTRQAAQQKFGK
jgi:hypothetical protein